MTAKSFFMALFAASTLATSAQTPSAMNTTNDTVTIRLIETSDVHGCFLSNDTPQRGQLPQRGSMLRIKTLVDSIRQLGPTVLLDNGDILQGQPINYYFNFEHPEKTNIAASIVNYMHYDASTVGNHDIETGHAVYDKWARELSCPVLGANIIDVETGKPYFPPYTIINRSGLRIAVIGMITPAIPNWLKPELWKGLRFDEITATARQWLTRVRQEEHPDIVVGLFHSGWDGGIHTDAYDEDASAKVAQQVPGFDVIFFGHDHRPHLSTETSADGNTTLCLDPANNAVRAAVATLTLVSHSNHWEIIKKDGKLIDVRQLKENEPMRQHFLTEARAVDEWTRKPIGTFTSTVRAIDSFFGPSAFDALIMNAMLSVTGADIAFNAPLSMTAEIKKGPVTIADMFKLYRYENQLYTMRLRGSEILGHLEMSYDLWANTMHSPHDHLFLLEPRMQNDAQRMGFKNLTFNFDSAAGIIYDVDCSKPDGQKVTIRSLADGSPFYPDRFYTVAVNSYRGNGGGELLTRGAGIPHDSLASRIIWQSPRDLRHYVMQAIERQGTVSPVSLNNWQFSPAAWTRPAALRDRQLLTR